MESKVEHQVQHQYSHAQRRVDWRSLVVFRSIEYGHMKVAHRPSTTPLDNIPTQWQICSPETVANFTACGYFMARKLQQELDVPIGLINSSWGGTAERESNRGRRQWVSKR